MQLLLAIFSLFVLQISLCLFGYFELEKIKSEQTFDMKDHSEYLGSIR